MDINNGAVICALQDAAPRVVADAKGAIDDFVRARINKEDCRLMLSGLLGRIFSLDEVDWLRERGIDHLRERGQAFIGSKPGTNW